jgi:hypothetical protein
MTNAAEAAKHTVEISQKHVLEQQFRIEKQRELLAKLERGDQPDLVAEARRFLAEMEQALAEMKQHAAAAQERLTQRTVDEASLAELEKDTPM